MIFSVLAHILSFLIDLLTCGRRTEQAKVLEILLLRQQLHVLQRTHTHPPRPSRWENLTLAVLTAKLQAMAKVVRHPWRHNVVLFTPETILRWHRDLVRRTWTFPRRVPGGRPRLDAESEALILVWHGKIRPGVTAASMGNSASSVRWWGTPRCAPCSSAHRSLLPHNAGRCACFCRALGAVGTGGVPGPHPDLRRTASPAGAPGVRDLLQ